METAIDSSVLRNVLLIVLVALGAMVPIGNLGFSLSQVIGADASSSLPTLGSRTDAAVGTAGHLARHASRVARFRRSAATLSNLDFTTALNASELEAAVRLARAVEDPQTRTQNLIQVAKKAGPESELWEAVSSTSDEIADLDARINSARLVAQARNELELWRTELKIAQEATDPAVTLAHVRRIAGLEGPNSSTWDLALPLIKKLETPSKQAQALLVLGTERGDVLRYLPDVLKTTGRIEEVAQRSQQLRDAFPHLGDASSPTFNQALDLALDLWTNDGDGTAITALINQTTPDPNLLRRVSVEGAKLDEGARSPVIEAIFARQQMLAQAGQSVTPPPSPPDDLIKIGELLPAQRRANLMLQEAQGVDDIDSAYWSAAYDAGNQIEDRAAREQFLQYYAQLEFNQLKPEIEHSVIALRQAAPADLEALDPHLIGSAIAPNRWPSLDDAADRAKLWRSASTVAQYFLEEAASHGLWKEAAETLRSIEDASSIAPAALEDLVDAMFGLDAHGSTPGSLFATIDSWGESAGSIQLLQRLVEDGNARAQGRALELAFAENTNAEDTQKWLSLLAREGVVDAELPQAMTTPASAHVVRRLYNDLGIQPDYQSLQHVLEVARQAGTDPATATTAQLDGAIDSLITGLKGLRGLDSSELVQKLAADQSLASTYFMMNGGRTKFPATQPDFNIFWSVLTEQKNAEDILDLDLFNTKAVPNEAWHEALKARRRPSDDLVWESTVGIPSIDPAAERINTSFQTELPWLLDGHARDEVFAPDAPEQANRKLASLLEDLGDPAHEHTLADFQALQKRLAQRARQMKKAAAQNGDADAKAQWGQIVEAIDDEAAPVMTAQHIPAILLKDPTLSLELSPALQSWQQRLQLVDQTLAQRRTSNAAGKRITMRYLDGVEDFVERTRFADCSGGGCFMGGGSQQNGEIGHTIVHKGRHGRDPHWFLITIEDTPADAATREVSASIFGSFGLYNDEPALMINGIIGGDGGTLSDHITNELRLRVAKPAGAKHIVSSSTGINHKSWTRPDAGLTVERPRAMRDTDGNPLTNIYDDIGRKSNMPHEARNLYHQAVEQ